jgi:4-hydroxybenzoate polyprenyltransferase
VARDIKLAHSVFALPFAVLSAFLARDEQAGLWRFVAQLGLVVVCMVAARTFAMVVNRLADRAFDAANPRTSRRAFASGTLSQRDGSLALLLSGVAFVAGAGGFWMFFGNWWPPLLALPVLGWVALYSYTKRFTWLCHVFLGGALAASPVAAALAIDPSALIDVPAVWWFAAMVAFWVAGFDVIYALQDVEFDQRIGLHSVPARFGVAGAVWISRGLHVLAAACLVMAGQADPRFGSIMLVATALIAALLVIEHVILAQRGKDGLEMAFFTINGIVSCVLGVLASVDLVL